jgi:ArsR family transcriptional regulator
MEEVSYFKALADPTRMRICAVLLKCELSVNEIVALFGMGQSRISRHLKILADCGILSCRRDGLWSFYTVAAKGDGKQFIDAISYLFKTSFLGDDIRRAEELLRERREGLVRFFNDAVRDWDRARKEVLGSFNLDEAISARIKGNGQLADLGCGDGNLAYLLASRGFSVIGVDASPGMITAARKKIGTLEKQLEFRIGELEHLPLRDGECDTVVVALALHHLSAPREGLSEISRILSNSGRIIIADFEKHGDEDMRHRHHDLWLGFSREEIAQWLTVTGFQLDSWESFKLESGIPLALISAIKL